jgi:TRAP-type C4-dicarboxylate transport system permease small subunit
MFTFGISAVDRVISKAERLCEAIADVSIFAIMLIVFSDIAMRYLLNNPIAWAYDVISLYLMAAAFFLSLSSTYSAHGHIGMDIFVRILPPRGRRAMEIVTCVLAIPLFGLMAVVGAERAYNHWINHDAISGLIAWPTWIGAAMVPAGAGLLIIRLTFRLVGQVASLVLNKDVVELIPIGGERVAE